MNITDLYSTRIQKTFDEDQAEIVSILKAHIKTKLKLISYFKGLPLSYPAIVAGVEKGVVDLSVQSEQAFTIEKCRSAFIRSPLFKHDIFAQALYANSSKGAATFGTFSYVKIMAERRNFIRMEPAPHTHTVIESSLGTMDGELVDISLSGLNILVHDSFPLETDAQVSIRFMLSDLDQSFTIKADLLSKLVGISGDKLPRNYHFTISPEKMLERDLSKYIFRRQIEIIKEIKDG